MAKNFHVREKQKGRDSVVFQLIGDFDASSACELITALSQGIHKNRKITIDTDRLRAINEFGLAVFLPQITRLKHTRADINVTGRFSEDFREC